MIRHPKDEFLREDRIPHIWCQGCGLGIVLGAYIDAMKQAKVPLDKHAIISGIGCTGRVAGYLNTDSFHTTHGRAIPFATGLKLANPELTVVVFSGDGDIFAIGGNHFIHAARRNVDIKVVCVNNFIYGMTGGQVGPTTPVFAKTTTTPYGNFEPAFSLPYVAASCGAVYVARWTSLHVRRLVNCFVEMFLKRGFSFVEVIAPCPTVYGRRNKLGTGLDMMKSFRKNCIIKHGADLAETEIGLDSKIVVGKFVDVEKPTFTDYMKEVLDKAFSQQEKEKKATS